jgi:hypothetical protein
MMNLAAVGPGKALCDDCTNILVQENLQRRYPLYTQTGLNPIKVLQNRAETGCPICSVVVAELSRLTPDSIRLGEDIGRHYLTLSTQSIRAGNFSKQNSNSGYVLLRRSRHKVTGL